MRKDTFLCLSALLFATEVLCVETYKSVTLLDETVRISCSKDLSLDNLNEFEKLKENTTVKEAVIDSCSPPRNSYADILKTININVPGIKKLIILNPRLTEHHNSSTGVDPIRPKLENFVGFEFEELQIINDNGSSILAYDLEFLKDLPVKKVTLNNAEIWSPFPDSSKIQELDLKNVTFHGNFGGCSSMKVLHIDNMQLIGDQETWLQDCLKLHELKLDHLSFNTTQKIVKNLSYLIRNITVRYSSQERFPDGIYLIDKKDIRIENKALRYLDLSHNNIKYGPYYTLFVGLETLDLSYNKLTHFDNSQLYERMRNLLELKLDGNNFKDICVTNYGLTRIRQTKADDWKYHKELSTPLRRISLSNTGLPYLCFGDTLVPHLEFLNVSNNNITELDYRTFYWVSDDNLVVDLTNNPLKTVAFTKEDYQSMKRNDPALTRWSKIRVRTNARLSCDCTLAWFARALREQLLTVDGAECEDGKNIEDQNVFNSC